MKSMKRKTVMPLVLATSLLFSVQAMSLQAVAAPNVLSSTKVASNVKATSKKPTVLQVKSVPFDFDGATVAMEVVEQSNAYLVNARAFANAIGATISFDKQTKATTIKRDAITWTVKADDKFTSLKGKKQFITHAPRVVKGKLYVEIEQFTKLMGGQIITDESGKKQFLSQKLLSGVSNPHIVDASHIVISKQVEDNFEHYLLNTTTRKTSKLAIVAVTNQLIPSPDRKHFAYTDENSHLYVYSLETNTESKISEDTLEKVELTWASDNSALFYIEGPSSNVISKMTLDGTITKVVDDKVNYKSDLFVHSNNTSFVYTVTKTGKTTADTTGVIEGEELPDFEVVIDPTGTEPQLYAFDAATEGATPKLLTSTTDNKTYAAIMSNGTISYISTDTADEEALGNLKLIDKAGAFATIMLADTDILAHKIINDKIIAFGYAMSDEQFMFEIDPIRGYAKKLAAVPMEFVNIMIGETKDQWIAEDGDGRLFIYINNSWKQITN